MGKFLTFQETALTLITQFGGPVTVVRKESALFDPITQTALENGQAEEFMAVVMPPSRQAEYKAQSLEINITAEVYFAMKDKTFTPGPGDTFDWGGNSYTIRHSQTFNPAADGPIMTVAFAE